ncbi:VOC family protein [Dictyobacter aurantiacus]|uniref:Glyoxalase n=1 Tax=Dictyobacter aurantiacus TaxID=1936993 RepID=A0A401ZR52_9CHLR|nr:VOC family protein [Dictyobacter aurantiacus]GCE09345.1 glyoxalase [Dictyobacter aurantiacus]
MNFVSIRVITDDVKRLVHFYEQVTGLSAKWYTEDFAELASPSSLLAIASTRTIGLFGANVASPAQNHTVIIEFLVNDVDREYEKLKNIINEFVMEPTTMPWGNRSVLFRDPDGNLVNFFRPTSADAIRKYEP